MTTPARHELAFEDVRMSFAGESVLRDVSLSFTSGERVAVVGPSGAGKTTLLRLAAGSVRPTSGTVTLDGHPVTRGDAALAYQGETLVDRRTALANVLSGRAGDLSWWRGLLEPLAPRNPEPARALLDAVDLGNRADERADALSAGERQRVAFARALIQDAPVVLADEPTANLDPHSQANVLDVLDDLVGERLLVTVLHDVDLALDRFDRVVGLADGRVRFDEPAEGVSEALLDDLFAAGASTPADDTPARRQDHHGDGYSEVEWYA